MNKIKEGAINKSDIVTGTTEANRTNIVNFLRAAGEYGVPAKYLFEVYRETIRSLVSDNALPGGGSAQPLSHQPRDAMSLRVGRPGV